MGGQPEIAHLCFAGTPRPLCMFLPKYAAVVIAVQEAAEQVADLLPHGRVFMIVIQFHTRRKRILLLFRGTLTDDAHLKMLARHRELRLDKRQFPPGIRIVIGD